MKSIGTESDDWFSRIQSLRQNSAGVLQDLPSFDESAGVDAPADDDWLTGINSLRAQIQEPVQPPEDGSLLEDIGRTWMGASTRLGGAVGYGLEKLGAETFGGFVRELSKDSSQYWDEGLTQTSKESRQKEFFTKTADGYEFGDAWTDPRAVGLSVVESLPGTIAGGLAGKAVTGGLMAASLRGTLARGLVAGGVGGTEKVFRLIPAIGPKVAAAIGYGSGEAGVAALSSGGATEDQVRAMSFDVLEQSPEYMAALAATGDREQARDVVARAAGNDATALTALTTFVLSAPAGAVLSKFFTNTPLATTRGRAIGLGAGTETVQEFFQSGSEQISQNLAIRDNADPTRQWDEGALNAAAAGAMAGGVLGGGMGAFQPLAPRPATPDPEAPSRAQTTIDDIANDLRRPYADAAEEGANQARDIVAQSGGDALSQELAASDVVWSAISQSPTRDDVERTYGRQLQMMQVDEQQAQEAEALRQERLKALDQDGELSVAWMSPGPDGQWRPKAEILPAGKSAARREASNTWGASLENPTGAVRAPKLRSPKRRTGRMDLLWQGQPNEMLEDPADAEEAEVAAAPAPRWEPTGNTVERVMADLSQDADIGAALGTLTSSRALNIVQSPDQLPPEVQAALSQSAETGAPQGLVWKGRMWLVADSIEAGRARGVLLHEGQHYAMERDENSETYKALQRNFDRLLESGDVNAVRAMRRVQSANTADVEKERVAYFLEEVVNNPDQASGRERMLAARIMQDVRLWFRETKVGKWLEAHGAGFNLTPQEIVQIVKRGMIRQAQTEARTAAPGGLQASRQEMGAPAGQTLAPTLARSDTAAEVEQDAGSEFRYVSGRPRKTPATNYVEALSTYSPTVYRETNLEEADALLPGSNSARDAQAFDGLFASESAELALGQGRNTGVVVELDTRGLKGQISRSKPTADVAWQSGQAEFVLKRNTQAAVRDAVRSVTVRNDAQGPKWAIARTKAQLNRLVAEQGWTKEETDAGVVYRAPAMREKSADGVPQFSRRERDFEAPENTPPNVSNIFGRVRKPSFLTSAEAETFKGDWDSATLSRLEAQRDKLQADINALSVDEVSAKRNAKAIAQKRGELQDAQRVVNEYIAIRDQQLAEWSALRVQEIVAERGKVREAYLAWQQQQPAQWQPAESEAEKAARENYERVKKAEEEFAVSELMRREGRSPTQLFPYALNQSRDVRFSRRQGDVSQQQAENFFAGANNVFRTEAISAAEEAWAGGVADFGDSEAAQQIQMMRGYFDYRGELEDLAREHFGGEFYVYRYGTQEFRDSIRDGEDTPPFAVTLSPVFAKRFKGFAGYDESDDVFRTWWRIKVDPSAIVMVGKESEYELVLDANAVEIPDIEQVDRLPEQIAETGVRFSRRERDFENPEDRVEVSTARVTPAPKKGRLSNSYDEKWVIDGSDVRASTTHMNKVYRALQTYNTLSGKGDAPALMKELHDVIVDNLLWLHDLVPEPIRNRARLWYDGANRIANDWSTRYDITVRQASGVLAVLSPQMDWFKNVSLAERVITILKSRQNEAWSPEMTAWLESWVNASRKVDEKAKRQAILDEARAIEGRTLAELNDREASIYVRVFDETYFERRYRLVTPEGGFGDYVTKNDEGESSVTWGGFETIEKAVSIMRDGSFRNVEARLGDEHKVRNFFNNIIAPGSRDGHVTIDTHAVAAALVKAVSGSSREVLDNFSAAGSNPDAGASGTYGLFADAYRDAALQRGILPREMQSITWEAIRALFPASMKSQLAPQIDAIWDAARQDGTPRDQAREKIRQLAGGIRSMAWEGSTSGTYASEGGASFNTEIAESPADRTARTLEPQAAKDSISVNLSANTGSIPGIDRLQAAAARGDMLAHRLLQDIALDNLRHLLAGTSARIVADGVTGLYGGYVESGLSLTITFADYDRAAVLAGLAKFAENYNQEQVHVRRGLKNVKAGTTYADGSYATPVYRWELKEPLSRQRVQQIIKRSGLAGLTFGDDFIETYYIGDFNEQDFARFEQNIQTAARLVGGSAKSFGREVEQVWPYGRGAGGIGYGDIQGDVPAGTGLTNETAKRVAGYLNRVTGPDGETKLGPVKTFDAAEITDSQRDLQAAIADIYNRLPENDLKNVHVRRAYEQLAKEVLRQFDAMPVKVEVYAGAGEPYANSDAMRRDLLDNNHLYIFGTTPETFGPPGSDFTGHPLLKSADRVDQNDRPLLLNDLLRAVHDYYAHSMSPTQFGPKGEEAAWKNHMAMTPDPWARWALTSETRGQNSWVNFRDGLDPATPLSQRSFAPQKAALMPVEYMLTGDRKVDAPVKAFIEKLGARVRQGSKLGEPSVQFSRAEVESPSAVDAELSNQYNPEPGAESAPDSATATPLADIQITDDYVIAETGETVSVTERADIRLRQLDKRLAVARRLVLCLGG